MTKPQPIIEDFAQRIVRQYDENKAKLDAARAMLAALKETEEFLNRWQAWSEFAPRDSLRAAIAAAKAAGIKTEG